MTFRWTFARVATVLLLSAGSLATSPSSASAQRSLAVESFDVELDVRPDGDLRVTERIRYAFTGSWNGVFREIPVEYRTPEGFGKRMYIENVEITGEDGGELWYEDSRRGDSRYFRIRVPGAQNASRTVTIAYTMERALLFFEEHDELYWNVTGESEVPVASASATVTLPEGASNRRATVFTGGYRSTDRAATVTETERGFDFETTAPLGFREGMTVVVGWDPGLVERPTFVDNAWLFLRANWPLAVPILALLTMWTLWKRKGRDPARRPIQPRYEPPESMPPSEVGTLVDHHPHMRDITADLVHLAVQGYLTISEVDQKGLVALVRGDDYRFELLKDKNDWRGLPPQQRELLEGVFGSSGRTGKEVRMSDLDEKFYKHLPDIRDGIFDRLVEAGYYGRRPDKVKVAWGAGAAVILALLFPLGILAIETGAAPVAVVLAGVLTAVIVMGFAMIMPVRTVAGVRKLEEILGFEEFLERVESDRFKEMITGPEMFEHYLPYAMALGVEKRWAEAFEGLVTEPPDWYHGSTPGMRFTPTHFATTMDSMSSSASTSMASSPRSSGGSGFSGGGGGGFSGGGGGGGSTGGW